MRLHVAYGVWQMDSICPTVGRADAFYPQSGIGCSSSSFLVDEHLAFPDSDALFNDDNTSIVLVTVYHLWCPSL